MKRSQILRKPSGKACLKVPVYRKCKACRQPFTKASAWQTHCRAEACAVAAAEAMRLKREKAEAREHREKLADSKKLSHWLALTERTVHAYIHARDKGLPCISCRTTTTVQWEAGHWLSKGARPELRFVADQINLQCHRCNVQLSGNQAEYRIGLVAKIGEARVQELEGPHPPKKYTREQLAEMRAHYRAKTKALQTAADAA